MKATDLMIGDWVKPSCWNEQVLLVGEGRATVKSDSYTEDEIKPIPLTEEILESNGFDVMVFDNADKLFAYGSLCILEHKSLLTFKISDCRKRINYVHELQHALKLCGIEKQIEL